MKVHTQASPSVLLFPSLSMGTDVAGRPSVAKAWRDMFETQNVEAFLYPGSAVTVQ